MDPPIFGFMSIDVYSETQPLPTPLAWFAYHALDPLTGKLITAAVLFTEILVPFLFFATAPSVRAFATITQLALQLALALVGNYGFNGLLISVLCLSLLDDRILYPFLWLTGLREGKPQHPFLPAAHFYHSSKMLFLAGPGRQASRSHRIASLLFSLGLFGALITMGASATNVVDWKDGWPVDVQATFGAQVFRASVQNGLLVAAGFLAFLYMAHSLSDLAAGHLLRSPGKVIILVTMTIFLFAVSWVPLAFKLSPELARHLPRDLIDLAQATTPFHLSSSYGMPTK